MTKRTKVLITGAAGNLGGKIRSYLETIPSWELVLIDAEPSGDADIHSADLAVWNDAWVGLFRGVDAVLHLAADHRVTAPWKSLQARNVDALLNVLEASIAGGVRRFVLASSVNVLAGYRGSNERLTTDLSPKPETLYDATKAVGERLCLSAAERHSLSVVCLRVGAVREGDNDPELMDEAWYRQMWLSNRDWCQVAEKAIRVSNVSFAILNATSDNANMRWDLDKTRRLLGYEPVDSWRPTPEPERKLTTGLFQKLRRQRR